MSHLEDGRRYQTLVASGHITLYETSGWLLAIVKDTSASRLLRPASDEMPVLYMSLRSLR